MGMHRFLLFSIVLLVGCNCKVSYMDKTRVIQEDDKYKSCVQLEYMIQESEFMLSSASHRYEYAHLFTSNPMCMPMVQSDAQYNQIILAERIQYLKGFYARKKCDVPEKLKVDIPPTSIASKSTPSSSKNAPIPTELKPW